MEITEFLENFDNSQFPSKVGPWLNYNDFDPPFTQKELKEMERAGIIEHNRRIRCFRLTMKAEETWNAT